MPTFPIAENDIVTLAGDLIRGMTREKDRFRSPPLEVAELVDLLNVFERARQKANAAASAAKQATQEKRDAKRHLVVGMKQMIRYAEGMTYFDGSVLERIGWGAPRTRRQLELPGQVASLKILQEGPGWIALEWKPPPDGGKVHVYKVRRSRKGEEESEDIGTAIETSILLTGQERMVDWHYTVAAVNKAGDGAESNTVTAVL